MKTRGCFLGLFLTTHILFAQTIKVDDVNKKIDGEERKGYSTTVLGNIEDLQDQWLGIAKDISKVKKRQNYYLLDDLLLTGYEDNFLQAYTQVNGNDSLTHIWLGLNQETVPDSIDQQLDESIESFLYQFVFEVYKGRIQDDIEKAERAVNFKSKQNQNLINEEGDLKTNLKNSENEKIRLEKLLEEVTLKIEVLKQKIINNKESQEITYQELEQIKKVLERHKSRLKDLK